jgi:hypothetical protein
MAHTTLTVGSDSLRLSFRIALQRYDILSAVNEYSLDYFTKNSTRSPKASRKHPKGMGFNHEKDPSRPPEGGVLTTLSLHPDCDAVAQRIKKQGKIMSTNDYFLPLSY